MPLNPSTDNYTVPGGVALYFKEVGGSDYKHLGNILDVSLEPGADELEHYSNLSGKRMMDKVIVIEEKLALNFSFDEANIENMRYFFRGGDISSVGEGTGTGTDVKVTFDGTRLISVGAYYGLTSVSVRSFLDYCWLDDDSAGVFVDRSDEAKSTGGTPFECVAEAGDFLYLGKITPFGETYIDVQTPGSYGTPKWEFWNGSAWTTFVPTGAGIGFAADGKIVLGTLTGWSKYTLEGVEAYWIRFSAATITTPVTVNKFSEAGVVNVDWVLDPGQAGVSGKESGRVGRLAAGFFVDGEEVMVSFTYTTWTSQKIAIATQAVIEGAARLEVHPEAGRGHRFDLVFPRTSLKAKGAITLDDKDWLKGPMTLTVLDATTIGEATYPFGYYQSYGIAT